MEGSKLNTHQQDALEHAEKRRRKVVAAAVELYWLGAGNVFEAPVHRSLNVITEDERRLRVEELVDEIMVRTGRDVRGEALPKGYRYSWTHYPVSVAPGPSLVVTTPDGPMAVRHGSIATRGDTHASPREMRWPGEPGRAKKELRCPECREILYRVGEYTGEDPFLLVACSSCSWRGALYKDGDRYKTLRAQVEGCIAWGLRGGDMNAAWGFLEQEVAEALEGWECMTEERAREAASRVYHHLHEVKMLELANILAGVAVPWSSSSGAALDAAIHALDRAWQKGGLEEDVYVDTPHGRVGVRSELERLHEEFEAWSDATE